jgi:CubicO group peptidase (beta-lactamase class C family)
MGMGKEESSLVATLSEERGSWTAVRARLESAVHEGQAPGLGLLVSNAHDVVFAEAFGTYTLQTVAYIASATKVPTVSAILTLVDDGQLSLDDQVSRYLPTFGGEKAQITIRQCLSHTSGLPGQHDSLPVPWKDNGLSLSEAVDQIAQTPLVAKPGSKFLYGGTSYQVAGRVAEVVTGQSWAQLFQERIAGPLEMTSFTYGESANPRLGGGAACGLQDYGNLLKMHLAGGIFRGRRVLSAASVARMQQSQLGEIPFEAKAVTRIKPEVGYGLGWWIDQVDAQGGVVQVSDAGVYGCIPWMNLANSYAAFLFMNKRLTDGVAIYDDLLPLVERGLRSAVFGAAAGGLREDKGIFGGLIAALSALGGKRRRRGGGN